MKNEVVDVVVDLSGAQIDVLRLLKNFGEPMSSKRIFEMGAYFANPAQAAQTCFLLRKEGVDLIDRLETENGLAYQINRRGLRALVEMDEDKIDAGSWSDLLCGHVPAAYSVPQLSPGGSTADDGDGVYYAVPLSRFKLKPCRTVEEAEEGAMRASRGKPVVIIRAIEVVKKVGRFPAATLMA